MENISSEEKNNNLKNQIIQTNFKTINSDDFIVLLRDIEQYKIVPFLKNKEERYLLDIFVNLFTIFRSKDKRNYDLCYSIGKDIIDQINEWGCISYINTIKESLLKNESKNEREYAYKLLIYLIKNYDTQISLSMSELIPIVTNDTNSPIREVKIISCVYFE